MILGFIRCILKIVASNEVSKPAFAVQMLLFVFLAMHCSAILIPFDNTYFIKIFFRYISYFKKLLMFVKLIDDHILRCSKIK